MHLGYLPLVNILGDVLDMLALVGYKFKLVFRGVNHIECLSGRSFDVEYRTDFITEIELKKELDIADILYLPIKFTDPNFYLYSFSTKMIQYLGATGAILYHGPSNSAACNFLKANKCAICCDSLDVSSLESSILTLLEQKEALSINAKSVAISQFNLKSIQSQFWMHSEHKQSDT